MAFRVENIGEMEHQKPSGRYMPAAVMSWCTSKGELKPLMAKIEDEEGEVRTIENIQVLTKEAQFYAGSKSIKYKCQAVISEQMQEFILLFCPEDCLWKMVYAETRL